MWFASHWQFEDRDHGLTHQKHQLPAISNALPVPKYGLISLPLGIIQDEDLTYVAGTLLSAIEHNKLPNDPYGDMGTRLKCHLDGATLFDHYREVNQTFVNQLSDRVKDMQDYGFEIGNESKILLAALLPDYQIKRLISDLTIGDKREMTHFLFDEAKDIGLGISPVQTYVSLLHNGIDLGVTHKQLIESALSGESAQKDMVALSQIIDLTPMEKGQSLLLPPFGELNQINEEIINRHTMLVGINGGLGFVAPTSKGELVVQRTASLHIEDENVISAFLSPDPTFDDMDIIEATIEKAKLHIKEFEPPQAKYYSQMVSLER